ncbi:TonB-dependent receptor domain-containing protein [Yunchengibacter salinarum]|uniref:TonB-dependent receptor domain-containing protein n=1 Tax=Yunchengibacter salinarum TaxID=3133399 RepID=UPI0035B5C72B
MTSVKTTLKRALMASWVVLLPATGQMAAAQDSDTQGMPGGDIEEVVVQGQYVPDEKRNTSEISNVLDSEAFARTGDGDIAVALSRVTGLSMSDGKFVIVRGLGERYQTALLDGSLLPSPSPLRRVVPLDIFPTALLESVLVQKTFSPEYPGQFGGGVINMRTKAVPDEFFMEVGVGTEVNTATTFKRGLDYDGPNSEAFTFGGSLRDLPDPLSNAIANSTGTNSLLGLSQQELEVAGESLPNRYSIDLEDNLPGLDMSFALGDVTNIDGTDLGFTFALDYDFDTQNKFGLRRTFAVREDGSLDINQDLSQAVCERSEFEGGGDDCGRRETRQNFSLNGLFSVGAEFNANHAVKATTTVLRQSTKSAVIEKGEFAFDPGTLFTRSRIDWVERQVWSNQISGDHAFDLIGGDFQRTMVKWRANYSRADRDAPLRRQLTFEFFEFDQSTRLDPRFDRNETTFAALDDESIEAGIDIIQPVTVGEMPVDFKAGFTYYDKDRSSAFRRFNFEFPSAGQLPDTLLQRPPETIFGPRNIGPGGITLRDSTNPSDTFLGQFENVQAYVGVDAQVTPSLRLAAGMRLEDLSKQVDTFRIGPAGERIRVTLDAEQYLPAFTATWEFQPNMQFRLGYSQTIDLPDLRELSNSVFLDEEGFQQRGNPELELAEIENFDARFEWYFGNDESLSVAAFYKDFTNPIERTFNIRGLSIIRSFDNADSAELLGIEAELDKKLNFQNWFGWDWLGEDREFYIKTNVSVIDSEVTIIPDDNDLRTNLERNLQGQSDFLYNATIGFDDYINGESAALVFNFTGNRIDDVGLEGRPDVIEEPPIMLNFVYRREIDMFDDTLELKLEAENLLFDDFLRKQGDRIAETYPIGASFSLGLTYRF